MAQGGNAPPPNLMGIISTLQAISTAHATLPLQGIEPQDRPIPRGAPPYLLPGMAPQLAPQDPPATTTMCAKSHSESLTQRRVDTPNRNMSASLVLLTMLDATQGSMAQSHLELLATLLPSKHPSLAVCVARPAPHIRVLLGQQFVVPPFAHPTTEDENIPTFLRDICKGEITAYFNIPDHWIEIKDTTALTTQELHAALLAAPQGLLLTT